MDLRDQVAESAADGGTSAEGLDVGDGVQDEEEDRLWEAVEMVGSGERLRRDSARRQIWPER